MERSRIDITDIGTDIGTDTGPEPGSAPKREAGKDASPEDRAEKDDAEKRAVALTYKPDNPDAAPVVSASGKGFLAEKILELAEAEGVPIRQDADLVELLAATEVGDEIPVEAFIAVAEVLRYVYDQNGQAPPKFD